MKKRIWIILFLLYLTGQVHAFQNDKFFQTSWFISQGYHVAVMPAMGFEWDYLYGLAANNILKPEMDLTFSIKYITRGNRLGHTFKLRNSFCWLLIDNFKDFQYRMVKYKAWAVFDVYKPFPLRSTLFQSIDPFLGVGFTAHKAEVEFCSFNKKALMETKNQDKKYLYLAGVLNLGADLVFMKNMSSLNVTVNFYLGGLKSSNPLWPGLFSTMDASVGMNFFLL